MQHYLFVHFREKTSPDGEQVHFAISRDGFHWQALNGGHPVLWAYYGDRGVRDMTIVRDHTSGKFHIFATDLSLSYGMRNQYQHSWREYRAKRQQRFGALGVRRPRALVGGGNGALGTGRHGLRLGA